MPDHPQPPDDAAALPGVLEVLLRAEADFAWRLREAAPLPEGSPKDGAHLELMDRHDRYLPSAEVTAIARLLYMLDAYGVTDGEAMGRLIDAHNARVAELAGDAAYLARLRVPKSKLLEARFSGPARHNAVANVREHGRAALDKTTMGRLLVEFANKTQVDEAARLLRAFGFFAAADGDYNSKVYLSTGKLEALYRSYLAQVARGVGEVLGQARGRQDSGPGTRRRRTGRARATAREATSDGGDNDA